MIVECIYSFTTSLLYIISLTANEYKLIIQTYDAMVYKLFM